MFADLGDRQRAVRAVGGVADVDDVLVGQQVDDGARDGQAADAGVEDADGSLGIEDRRERIGTVCGYDDTPGVAARSRFLRSREARNQAASTPAIAPNRCACHETNGLDGSTPHSSDP